MCPPQGGHKESEFRTVFNLVSLAGVTVGLGALIKLTGSAVLNGTCRLVAKLTREMG